MVIVPLVVDILYQGWKWPLEVAKDFDIKIVHYKQVVLSYLKLRQN
jgi:hypothetical protein